MGAALRNHDDEFDDQPMSDINVTPLVDVMLVLLIVFMVAAPLMTSGVPVDLPKTQAKPLNDQKPPIAVTLDAGGKYFVGNTEVQPEELLSALLNQSENGNGLEQRIHVRADKELPYRVILEVMGKISSAGFTKVALVSDPSSATKLPLRAPAASTPLAPTTPASEAQPASPGSALSTPATTAPTTAAASPAGPAPTSVAPAVAPPASSVPGAAPTPQ